MPGYTIGESLKDQTTKALNQIVELVQSHDVIYLLTDSRESRWLPTMLAAAHDKVRFIRFNIQEKNLISSIFPILIQIFSHFFIFL